MLAMFTADEFGNNFLWGIAMSALQNEGACDVDGRGASIWDTFSKRNVYYQKEQDASIKKALPFITN
jgi:beta-glucosidase/6-phospho-beta-glucosidase/beta-galactosidase